MLYRIYSKHLYYEIELNGKYTILLGDSGSGKSLLYNMIYVMVWAIDLFV